MSKTKKSLEQRLEAHPELKEHLLGLLELAESGIESADRVEELTVGGIKGLGRQVMQDWAEQQEAAKSQALGEGNTGVRTKGKKTPLDDDPRRDSHRRDAVQVGVWCTPTFQRNGRSSVSRVFPSPAASDHRFRLGEVL